MKPQAHIGFAIGFGSVVLFTLLQCSNRVAAEEPLNSRQVAAEEQPMTVRELTLNEVRTAVLATPHDTVRCFQERQRGRTHVCITEAEWLRIHANDAQRVEQ